MEYLRGLQHKEFQNHKRMRSESNQTTPPSKRKQHSMALLTTVVNQTIWDLYRNMDFFEYEYDVTIELEPPKNDENCRFETCI